MRDSFSIKKFYDGPTFIAIFYGIDWISETRLKAFDDFPSTFDGCLIVNIDKQICYDFTLSQRRAYLWHTNGIPSGMN